MYCKLASNITPGEKFYHHLNVYVACNSKQAKKHPARDCTGLLAYHIQDSGPVVPVRFNLAEKVFVK
jgi:hypothetical protein